METITINTTIRESEVARNKETIEVGDVLFYIDDANCQKWVVTDVFNEGFEAADDYEVCVFFFSELQHGWQISEKTKSNKKLYRTAQYN